MTCKHLLLLVFSITLLTNCTHKQTQGNYTNQTINWSEETPESIKTRISSSARHIEILSAFFNLTMNPPPEKMLSAMSGVITIDHRRPQPKVRIRAFHLFGSTLFDMVNTDITRIYVPHTNIMYVGGKSEQKQSVKGPQTIFANMMLDATSLVLQPGKSLQINTDSVTLYLQNGWLTLDKKTGLITTRHKEDLDIHYKNYTTFANTVIPTTIAIQTVDGSFTATCTLSKISRPRKLPENYFSLAEYQPETVMDLKDLQ